MEILSQPLTKYSKSKEGTWEKGLYDIIGA